MEVLSSQIFIVVNRIHGEYTYILFWQSGAGKMNNEFLELRKLSLYIEFFGEKTNTPVFLIMGACSQGLYWTNEFCERLAKESYYVIRYDHRDTGKSSAVNISENPYNILDLMLDAYRVLEHVKVDRAHIVGSSMGGVIAQLLAINFPHKILSLTVLSSTTDLSMLPAAIHGGSELCQSDLPYPWPLAMKMLTDKMPAPTDEMSIIKNQVASWCVLNGTDAPFDEMFFTKLAEQAYARTDHWDSAGNHIQAIANTRFCHAPQLNLIKAPTLVIHGTSDPLVPIEHGESIVKSMPSAKWLKINGMGHILTPYFMEVVISNILNHFCNKFQQ